VLVKPNEEGTWYTPTRQYLTIGEDGPREEIALQNDDRLSECFSVSKEMWTNFFNVHTIVAEDKACKLEQEMDIGGEVRVWTYKIV